MSHTISGTALRVWFREESYRTFIFRKVVLSDAIDI